jgi:UDP-glucose 4-epimerase
MKALVTGGCGFLGSHIVRALIRRGDEVVVFDHRLTGKCLSEETLQLVEPIEGDVFDAGVVRQAAQGCSAIFHCAAMVGVDAYGRWPAKTMETEQVGLRNVCLAAVSVGGARVVYASSSAVYGHAGGRTGLDEALTVAPVSNYGIAKRFNELYLAAQHVEHGLQSTALRIFNIYGPGQDERLAIPRFIHRALRGEALEIYGDGSQTRDFVYVDDVVRIALGCADAVAGCEVVNACSGREVSIRELAATIVRLSRSRSAVETRNVPAGRAGFEVARSFGSREKLEGLIGCFSPTSLEEGLSRTIAGVRQAKSSLAPIGSSCRP